MHYWIGVTFFIIGTLLFYRAYAHRARVMKIQEAVAANPEQAEATNTFNYGLLLAPMVNFGLLVTAVVLIIGYASTDLSTVISWVDLLGVFFCFIGYATLVNFEVAYRPMYLLAAKQQQKSPAESSPAASGEA